MTDRRLFFAALALPFVLGDSATALECGKARTAIEKAICGDAKLKDQDAALSRFYFDTLRSLKGDRHALLIADQRRWLEEGRNGACDSAAKPSALIGCLVTSLAARRRALAICFAGAKDGAPELEGRRVDGADICTLLLHTACPKVTLTASAGLAAYPWLMQQLAAESKKESEGFDCGPSDDGASGSPDQNESNSSATILSERPNLVSVRYEDDEMFSGAAHPSHDERIVSYDTRTKAELPIATILPSLKAGSPLLAKISKAANKGLSPSCCGDQDPTFSGIGLDSNEPMPGGWAVAANGDLILAYAYNAMARDFVATATIPRSLFIDAVDPNYAAIFAKDPKAP